MQYRRSYIKGGTYFFTVVTYNRRTIFNDHQKISLLRHVFGYVMKRHLFKIDAIVIMPDHLHCIWTLPEGDHDFSKRWRLIKGAFSRSFTDRHKSVPDKSRAKKQERSIWQRRFWEHLIRDDEDYRKHVEYIHYNSVKHGLVKSPIDWPYSSFHRYVRDGIYEKYWGSGSEMDFDDGIGKE